MIGVGGVTGIEYLGSIIQDLMLQVVNTSNHWLNPYNITRRNLPLQVMCDMANAVLDGYTGDLLKYWHLIRRSNFLEAWGNMYGK